MLDKNQFIAILRRQMGYASVDDDTSHGPITSDARSIEAEPETEERNEDPIVIGDKIILVTVR